MMIKCRETGSKLMKVFFKSLLIVLMFLSLKVSSITPSCFSVDLISGLNFHYDNNECSLGVGPRAVYVAIKICNNCTQDLDNIIISLDNFSTAGYSLAGNQTNPLSIKNPLLSGACDTVYFFCTYPCGPSSTNMVFKIKDLDDGTSFMDTIFSISNLKELSANAGSFVQSHNLTTKDSINNTECFTVNYRFSKLVPSNEVFLQPVANLDFRADCFQLQRARVISSDFNTPGCIPVGNCPLYYYITETCGGSGGSTWGAVVEYCFKVQCPWTVTTVIPYSSANSGNPLKYEIAANGYILPVELVEFKAKSNQDNILVFWKVLSESGISYYELQKSSDAVNFQPVMQYLPQNNSIYAFVDYKPIVDNYYRLKIVEGNTEKYSDVIYVKFDTRFDYFVYLNPITNILFIKDKTTGNSPSSETLITIFDCNGKLVNFVKDENAVGRVDIANFEKGVYFIQILSNMNLVTLKFIKQ